MKRVRTNQPQRYQSMMLEMAKQGTFNPTALMRQFHVGNTASRSLIELGYTRTLGRGQHIWVAGDPTANDVQKVIAYTSLHLQKERNKRAGIVQKLTPPLFEDKKQQQYKVRSVYEPQKPFALHDQVQPRPATKPQEAVQQPIVTPVVSTPTKRHSLLVQLLTLPFLAIIMAIQGIESYFKQLWKTLRQ